MSSGSNHSIHKPIVIIQGAQWGSEAKGMVAAAICQQRSIDIAVRTGGVNAGHTVYHSGEAFKMQQLPTGWVNAETKLVLGPGAFIDPSILANEIRLIDAATGFSPIGRIWVDYRAAVHLPHHQARAKAADRHHKMGATGKGCSEAYCDKIRTRGSQERQGVIFHEWLEEAKQTVADGPPADEADYDWIEMISTLAGIQFCDVPVMLNDAYDHGRQILIEGTQGTLLDINLGPWPYTTHKPTTAAQWVTEAGLAPSLKYEVMLVARTFPIRVAGNSGPMKMEIEWPDLARRMNAQRIAAGIEVLVNEQAIEAFEAACAQVARPGNPDRTYRLPNNEEGHPRWDFQNFTPEERIMYRDAISELHADALKLLDPLTIEELSGVFEFTTVTKKLRRVAMLSLPDIRTAVMLNRPACIVLTFLNYMFPELWNATGWSRLDEFSSSSLRQRVTDVLRNLEAAIGIPITHVSTGPEACHLLATADLYQAKMEGAAGATD